MKQSFFQQVKETIQNVVSNRSEHHKGESLSNHENHKSHNGELDISGEMLKAVMSDASSQEQEKIQHFENSLNQTYNTKQAASSHTPAGQMEIAEDMLSHIENNASPSEQAQLHELAEDLEKKN
ncbi:hypothetical protein ABEP17_08905 [Priestia flexa]|uniref:DUF3813 domain-containing protein n=1 Tax=Priestia flexa TaxID=86664 RepID=A0ABU4J8M0_9BACI|nr:hypothetical protein [Priestia flexa]MCA1203766.1 hypothetical protein [Priestia flexa]MCP1188221.1 hypothetical protein [Priestia flexa]MDW8517360.1 hypothetical protein [Priestia flexa]